MALPVGVGNLEKVNKQMHQAQNFHDSFSASWWDQWTAQGGGAAGPSPVEPIFNAQASSRPSLTHAAQEQPGSRMAFQFRAGSPPQPQHFRGPASFAASSVEEQDIRQPPPQFDIVTWYPQYQSCHRYFLDHAQHCGPVQALAAFINIKLPFQKLPSPILSSSATSPRPVGPESSSHIRQQPFSYSQPVQPAPAVSLVPYIRRLIATGHDSQGVLHGFFGDDWREGVGALHEIERRNYLFAAKSASWMKVKEAYDMSPDETCPFLSPLRDVTEAEIRSAESTWSEWLAMQDWMLGPRAPEAINPGTQVKREAGD